MNPTLHGIEKAAYQNQKMETKASMTKTRVGKGQNVPEFLNLFPDSTASKEFTVPSAGMIVKPDYPALSPHITERIYPISSVVSTASTPFSVQKCFINEEPTEEHLPAAKDSWRQSIVFPPKLVSLLGAHYAVSCISGKTRIIGTPPEYQEVFALSEYLKIKNFRSNIASTSISGDFQDLCYPPGFRFISSLFYVPLSTDNQDFIAFFKSTQGPPSYTGGRATNTSDSGRDVVLEAPAHTEEGWSPVDREKISILCLSYQTFINAWEEQGHKADDSPLKHKLTKEYAHELRTPLNHVISHQEMALDGQNILENLSKAHSGAKLMTCAVNDFLDLVNAESGKNILSNDIFNLAETVLEATGIFYEEARQKKVALNSVLLSTIPPVLGDQRRIRQVITNLVENAVKHTSSGAVTVELRILEYLGSESLAIEIGIHDTGSGMSQATIDRLFCQLEEISKAEELQKPHELASGSLDSKKLALGAGLAMVARIVHNMNGQLTVRSEEGKGSSFKLKFKFTLAAPISQEAIYQNASTENGRECHEILEPDSALDESHGSNMMKKHKTVPSCIHKINFMLDVKPVFPNTSMDMFAPPQCFDPVAVDEMFRFNQPKSSGSSGRASEPGSYFAVSTQSSSVAQLFDESTRVSYPIITPSTESGSLGNVTLSKSLTTPNSSCSRSATKETRRVLKILVAEDDITNRRIMEKRLQKMGHNVTLTVNGKECFDTYKDNNLCFDVILMDLQMPIMDGLTATKKIREHELENLSMLDSDNPSSFRRIPIFSISASSVESERQIYIDGGFDGWFLKPIDFSRLRLLLDGLDSDEVRRQNTYVPGTWKKGGWL